MWQNILQSLQQELNRLSATLSFAPAWAIWAALLVGAFAVACFVHACVLEFLDRILRQRRPYLNRVLAATKNPTRLALLLIALAIVLPPAPLGTDTRLVFLRCWCSPRFARSRWWSAFRSSWSSIPADRIGCRPDQLRTVESRSEVRDRLSFLGLTPQTSPPPEALQGFIGSELIRWGKVVKSAGLAGTE